MLMLFILIFEPADETLKRDHLMVVSKIDVINLTFEPVDKVLNNEHSYFASFNDQQSL